MNNTVVEAIAVVENWVRMNGGAELYEAIEYKVLGFVLTIFPSIRGVAAFTYLILSTCVPLILGFIGLYLINKIVWSTNKKASDPTNVNLFDRGVALLGLIVPYVELCLIFKGPIKYFPWLMTFNRDYLALVKISILCSPYSLMVWNYFVFREFIRRRGPDTEWAGTDKKKYWIKYFIRYYWCFGFCLAALEEPYNFVNVKIIELLTIPPWLHGVFELVPFLIFVSLIGYSILCILIGVTSKIPLFHGACEFHAGKPRKD
jgi:hypothetical protein